MAARHEEIEAAMDEVEHAPTHVCVVPVRMTEAWLLGSEPAIREAAGNPNGSTPLELPPMSRLERLPNPKQVLRQALQDASELTGRRRDAFRRRLARRVHRVAEVTEDFGHLGELPAFQALDGAVEQAMDRLSLRTS